MIKPQDIEQELPSVADFDSLVLEPKAFKSGGFGAVFKARHPRWGVFALKKPTGIDEPDSADYRHLLQEAVLWETARHPNVLRFLGIWEANDTVYLVSFFLDNGTVMKYLGAHPDADRPKFILDVARGLLYLHQIGIVHGDIKGSNILISPTLDALVADFGLSKLVDSTTNPSLKGYGSQRWQAPEVLRGRAPRTFSSDVYSFGMTICEILSGRPPFDGVDGIAIFSLVTIEGRRPETEPRLSPTGHPYAMQWRAARRCWNDEPLLRPTMGAILHWLESRGIVRGRIRVLCDRKPRLNGYIAVSMFSGLEGCLIVTTNVSEAGIIEYALEESAPRYVITMPHLGCPPRPESRKLYHQVISIASRPPFMSQTLNTVVSKVRDQGQIVSPYERPASLWMMTDDGEICPNIDSEAFEFEGMLHPVVLTALSPPQLVFCSNFAEAEDLPNVRMVLEEIDTVAL